MTPQYFQHNSANFCEMENKESKSYIERIEIKGLWGRFDVNWKLHTDVNILVGENGTGKSTILKFIESFSKWENADIRLKSEFMKIVLDNGFSIGMTEHDILPLKWPITHPVKLLQTFESKLLEKDTISKITQKNVQNSLDLELYNLETEYWKYQIELFERIVNQGFSKEEVNKNHNLFLQKINNLFKATGKVFGQNSKDKTIIFKQNGLELSLYQLSSGEKQMLIILLTVLLQDQKPSILLLDEPEISMHLTWQYELIEIIRTLNPNCQVIIVTHSPSIFTDGWNDRVFWIEDICKPSQKLEKV